MTMTKPQSTTALIIFIIISILSYFWIRPSAATANSAITVTRGVIVEQALAVGNIEPEHSITVTSTIPGIVKVLWHEEGDAVKAGEPLLEIKPDPTPLDLDNARRDLQQKQAAEQMATERL